MKGFEGRELLFRKFSEGEMSEHFGIGAKPSGVVMQYTGYVDKNGKKIFEGDIFKWVRVWPDGTKEVVLEYVSFGFCGWNVTGITGNRANGTEVIGNVFEHPHLLEEVE